MPSVLSYRRFDGIIGVGFLIQYGGVDQHSISWPDKPAERFTNDALDASDIQIMDEHIDATGFFYSESVSSTSTNENSPSDGVALPEVNQSVGSTINTAGDREPSVLEPAVDSPSLEANQTPAVVAEVPVIVVTEVNPAPIAETVTEPIVEQAVEAAPVVVA